MSINPALLHGPTIAVRDLTLGTETNQGCVTLILPTADGEWIGVGFSPRGTDITRHYDVSKRSIRKLRPWDRLKLTPLPSKPEPPEPRAAWPEFAEQCPDRRDVQAEPLFMNRLAINVAHPAPRCMQQSPDGRGAIYYRSGGSLLMYGECRQRGCPRLPTLTEEPKP
jgi:hypothetical protein